MTVHPLLDEIRRNSGPRRTLGLTDARIAALLPEYADLAAALDAAAVRHRELRAEHADLINLPEQDLIARIQRGYVNFYRPEAVNPYVALSAKGPWVVTTHGAVVHDNGGYGMLGQGHTPELVLEAMSRPQVMANVMTANLSQLALDTRLRRELGHTRAGGCPFDRFICLNSGSEAMSLALRLSDVNAARQTAPGAPHAGKRIAHLAIAGGFHGRTNRPARISDSCRKAYEENLASFREHDDLFIIPQNDVAALQAAFAWADDNGVFFDAVYMEPVQGEGSPGRPITRAFYDTAVHLAHSHGGLVVIDSIQAGLRAHGVLSVVDYPGFSDCVPPDIETWSKALNAGQYPLSVIGFSERGAKLHVHGIYGNTMTTNPRAADVACAVLDGINDAMRENIRTRGKEFVARLRQLQEAFPSIITSVQGTGLLFCAELDPSVVVVGFGAAEERCRISGLGVVHGGVNALRFTPHFGITSGEIDLILDLLHDVLSEIRAAQAA